MTLLGELALWVALLMATWGTTVSYAGGTLRTPSLVASGERAVYATLAFVLLASIGLLSALLRSDFSLEYVASYTSANLPTPYKISAFWAGQSGSLLFWALVLSTCAAVAVWASRRRLTDLAPYIAGTLSAVTLFFLLVTAFGSNPYERLTWLPPDGQGMNPQLQNPGTAIHPPSLYLGYATAAVPFACAIAALITRRLDAEWLGTVRRWALLSWVFLTIGILTGMWRAYVEPDWGGHWAWDPVENASVLPWLTGTVSLRAIMGQEQRGVIRKWNATLLIVTFLLAIVCIVITLSGSMTTVHSFAPLAAGFWSAGLLIAGIGVSAYLVSTRLTDLQATALVARNRRRAGGYAVLVGIVAMSAAFVGLAFTKDFDVSLSPGETFSAPDPFGRTWTFASNGVSRYDQLNRRVTALAMQATPEGEGAALITSEKRQYVDSRGVPTFEPSAEAGILETWRQDVYIVLAGVTGDERAEVRISFIPLMRWVWLGGAIMVIGGVLVMWPPAWRERVPGAAAGGDDEGSMLGRPSTPEAVTAMPAEGAAEPDDPIEALIGRYRGLVAVCPDCGVRPEPAAAYCSRCGRRLDDGNGTSLSA